MNLIPYEFKISKIKLNKLFDLPERFWTTYMKQASWDGELGRSITYKVDSEIPKEFGVFRKF